MALYAFKAYFNGSWLFGFRFHLCHWKRWKGQLCDLSSLKVIPQADWLCQWLVGSRWIASSTWSGPQAPRCAEGYQVTVSDWTFYSPAPEVSVASQVEYKLDRIILCTYTYISYIMCIYIHIYSCSRSIFRQYSLLEGGNPTHLHETSRLWADSRGTQKLYRMMLHIGRSFQPLSNMPSPPEGSEEIEGTA